MVVPRIQLLIEIGVARAGPIDNIYGGNGSSLNNNVLPSSILHLDFPLNVFLSFVIVCMFFLTDSVSPLFLNSSRFLTVIITTL